MCLYTKYITNKKYQPNRKNNFNAPVCEDRRLLLVPAKCGKCIECRKARKREWVIRLNEEIRNNPEKATFWTLTISNEDYEKLKSNSKKKDRDSICKLAVKRMLERIRKKTKKICQTLVYHRTRREYRKNTPTRYMLGKSRLNKK